MYISNRVLKIKFYRGERVNNDPENDHDSNLSQNLKIIWGAFKAYDYALCIQITVLSKFSFKRILIITLQNIVMCYVNAESRSKVAYLGPKKIFENNNKPIIMNARCV